MNLGNQIADFFGAYLLAELGVHPRAAVGESHTFDNLWIASAWATLLPAVTILLIPVLMPQNRQTDKLLLNHPASATAGSPMNNWLGGSNAEDFGNREASSQGSGLRSHIEDDSSTPHPIARGFVHSAAGSAGPSRRIV